VVPKFNDATLRNWKMKKPLMNRRITYALMRREAGGKALMRGKGIAIHGLYTSRTNDVTIEVHNKCKTQFVMERSTECTQKSAISSRQVPPDGMSETLLCSIYIYIYIYLIWKRPWKSLSDTHSLSLSLSLSLSHTHTHRFPSNHAHPLLIPRCPALSKLSKKTELRNLG